MNMLTQLRSAEDFLPATFGGLHELFRTMFDHVTGFGPEWMPEGAGRGMDVEVGENEVVVTLPMPGCDAKAIEIEVVGDQLSLKAARKLEKQQDGKHYIRRERAFMDYHESVLLPVKVRGHEATAKYTDGVLTVTLPREMPARPAAHVVKVD